MARAVHVCVVAIARFVFHVRGRYRDTTSLLFRGIVDLLKGDEFTALQFRHDLGQGRCQGGLTVINVTDRAHIHVGLISYKFLFRHKISLNYLLPLIIASAILLGASIYFSNSIE